MKIENYKEIRKGSIVSSFNLTLPKWNDFQIRGITLFESNGKRWISMPSRQYDDPATGKKKYYPYVAFVNRELNDKFNEMIIQTLDEYVKSQSPNVKPLDNSEDDLPF